MRERLLFLDALKGFAILLMVMAHIIAWSFRDWHIISKITLPAPHNVLNAGFLWQLIYSFHMPLFFLISGYLSFKNTEINKLGDLVLKRTKRLFIPYITTGFLILLLKGYYGYWFLFSLWQLSILAIILDVILSKINKNNSWWIDIIFLSISWLILGKVCSISVLNNILGPFCDFGKCYNYSIPFLFGFYMKKHIEIEIFLNDKFSFLLCIFIIMFSVRYFSPEHECLLFIHTIITKISSYTLGICGSLLFWGIFKHINNESKILQTFCYLGKNTMQIYVLHLLFAIQIVSVGEFWLSVNFPTCISTQIIYSFFMAVIAIVLSLTTDAFIKKSKVIHSFFFGQQ